MVMKLWPLLDTEGLLCCLNEVVSISFDSSTEYQRHHWSTNKGLMFFKTEKKQKLPANVSDFMKYSEADLKAESDPGPIFFVGS